MKKGPSLCQSVAVVGSRNQFSGVWCRVSMCPVVGSALSRGCEGWPQVCPRSVARFSGVWRSNSSPDSKEFISHQNSRLSSNSWQFEECIIVNGDLPVVIL